MNRREFLSTSAAQALAPKRRPNVLYLHSHDTGRYIQPYGHAVPTPNLQKFAGQGVLFRRAYSGAPTCSPSRAALLTGQTAHGSGMLGLAHRGFSLSHPERHLANFLQSHGYDTTLCNVQHETKAGTIPSLGYQRVLKTASNRGPDAAAAAVEYLNSKPKAPFFLSCGFFETHREYPVAGPKEDPRYTLPPAPLPDTPAVRQDMANFKAAARVLDDSMGSILEALARNGLEENTLVVLTTDHGIAFPAMKCNLTDHGIGVMLMMRGPGGFLGGKVSDAMVSHLDVYPTLCETLELPKPAWLEGRPLTPLVKGSATSIRDEVFAEVSYHAAYEPKRALRTERYKYIRNFGDRALPVLPNCDDGLSKSYWLEQGWKQRPVPREELYDLVFDPNEANNLATRREPPAELDQLRGRLDRWMKETDDPLLRGPVPAPRGAQVNDPAGLSPREPVTVVP
ncbi:MAG: sulfatase [Acidobacteria bacterium]|nr:sulfatase [Acidobacteriota bacterium]